MKTIGIISDTHSFWDDRFKEHFAQCDEIWHAGDIGSVEVADALAAVAPVFRAVCGNCDGGELRSRYKPVQVFTTEGVKVVLTHIGGYPGHYAPGVAMRLDISQPRLFVCGHSHILKIVPDHNRHLLHVNPGAAGHQGWQTVRTLVRLTLDAGAVTAAEVIELDDGRHDK